MAKSKIIKLDRNSKESDIRSLEPVTADKLHGLGDHLFLRQRATGRKTFIIRRKVGAKMTSTTLGDWPEWTLQRAKAAAATPTAQPAERITFGDAATRFCSEMIEARYRSRPNETCAFFVRDAAELYPLRLSAVTRQQFIGLITKKHKTAPNSARKMLAIYKQFSKWSVLHDLLLSDPLSVVTVGNLGLQQYEPRDRVLTVEELRHVLTAEGRWLPLMRFILATGCRIGEALQMTPEHVVGDVWTIPKTKNGKSHSLHLTTFAKEQIAAGWPSVCYEVCWKWAKDAELDWNFHDLRRTAATLMRQAGVTVEAVETVLNHSPGKLVQTYQRHDKLPVIKASLEVLEGELDKLKR